jgi:hypothetical protein
MKPFHISIVAIGPTVSISVGNLNFGDVPVGNVGTRSFLLSNQSDAPASFQAGRHATLVI